MTTSNIQFPCPVRRIRLVWHDGQWQIQKQVRIASMTLPKSSTLPSVPRGRSLTGAWFETVDTQGRTLYRRLIDNPAQSIEVIGAASGEFTRIPISDENIILDVLVPDVPEIEALLLYASAQPLDTQQAVAQRSAARVVATFNLREDERNIPTEEEDNGNN